MASLAKDYERYSKEPNVTFIGVYANRKGTMREMTSAVNSYRLRPFPNMLDSFGATATYFRVPANVVYSLVVLDANGRIGYSNAVNAVASAPGLLGTKDVPPSCKEAVALFNSQQFGLASQKLASIHDPAGKEFAGKLRTRMTELAAERLQEAQTLAESDPVQAYRRAQLVHQSFMGSSAAADAARLLSKLTSDQAVRLELAAESDFNRIVVPQMLKATTLTQHEKTVQPLFDGYLTRHGETRFAETAKVMLAAYTPSLSKK